jgi:hypothetical protein
MLEEQVGYKRRFMITVFTIIHKCCLQAFKDGIDFLEDCVTADMFKFQLTKSIEPDCLAVLHQKLLKFLYFDKTCNENQLRIINTKLDKLAFIVCSVAFFVRSS